MVSWFGDFDVAAETDSMQPASPRLVAASPELTGMVRSSDLLDEVLATGDLSQPKDFAFAKARSEEELQLQFAVLRGSLAGMGAMIADPFRAVAALEAGSTLIFNSLGARSLGGLRDFEETLAFVLGRWPQTNAYVSRGPAEGFGIHWDDHDVLILQQEGRKYWEIFRPVRLAPLRGAVLDDAYGDMVWSGVISAGDALFVPRGWGHRTTGLKDELSFHLTVGFKAPTGVDYLTWLKSRAGVDEAPGHRSSLDSYIAFDRAIAAGSVRTGPLDIGRLRDHSWKGAILRGRWFGGAVFPMLPPADDERVAIVGAGTLVDVHVRLLEFVETLFDGSDQPIEVLEEQFSCPHGGSLGDAIFELGRAGLIHVGTSGRP